jgi:magnesium chelatase family protein
MDRIDIHVHVVPPTFEELERGAVAEPPGACRARVSRAREMQARRAASGGALNANLGAAARADALALSPGARATVEAAVRRLGLSARAYHKVLRLARTIADLAGSDAVEREHVGEAVQYRSLDRLD